VRGLTGATPTTIYGHAAAIGRAPSSLSVSIDDLNLLVDIEDTDAATSESILNSMTVP
jgi:hypothetical protein